MAKLQRKTQKIFAGNTTSDQITAFGTAKTSSPVYTTDLDAIQTNTYTQGWTPSLMSDLAPYLQDSNALWFLITSQLSYLFQQGIAEWDAGTEYYIGSIVKVVSNDICKYYQSLTNNNVNNVVTDTSYWKEVFNVTSTYSSTGTTAVNGTAVASAITSAISNKLNTDHSNDTKPYLKTTYVSGTSGYNIWSNGYCEQWGSAGSNTTKVNLLKTFSNTSYNLIALEKVGWAGYIIRIKTKNTSNFEMAWDSFAGGSLTGFDWRACGYLASGQY